MHRAAMHAIGTKSSTVAYGALASYGPSSGQPQLGPTGGRLKMRPVKAFYIAHMSLYDPRLCRTHHQSLPRDHDVFLLLFFLTDILILGPFPAGS